MILAVWKIDRICKLKIITQNDIWKKSIMKKGKD